MKLAPIMRRILIGGVVLLAILGLAAAVTSAIMPRTEILPMVLFALGFGGLFFVISAIGIPVATVISKGSMNSGAFFGTLVSFWMVKFVVFLVLLFAVRGMRGTEPGLIMTFVVAAIVASLIFDAIVVALSRNDLTPTPTMPGEQTLGRPKRPEGEANTTTGIGRARSVRAKENDR
ncbi:hypothetical protein [Humidisolicoccus flavus]|uniref:hypothetical protein n=1 Tax=Humidisolicoccus flavus TaxID=3111414 RepID=UPI00324509FD